MEEKKIVVEAKKKTYKPRNWAETIDVAIEGIILATKTERNMKIHFLIALGAILIAIFLHLSKLNFLLIFIAVTMVLFAEVFNTSIEYLLDFLNKNYSVESAAIKNISAGAVLIAAFGAFVIGYEIFSKYLYNMIYYFLSMIKTQGSDIAIVVISLVLIITIVIKALINKGKPLYGGLPSGHAAVAFAIWLMVSLFTLNPLVSLLTFILAFIIASSRLYNGIHSRFD